MTEKQAKDRCGDCEQCVNSKGTLMCIEMCTPTPITEIDADECPLGFELDEIEQAETKAKQNKVEHGARSDKERKPRKPKPKDLEKESLVGTIHNALVNLLSNCKVINPNNEIGFDYKNDSYSLKIVKHRKKKE